MLNNLIQYGDQISPNPEFINQVTQTNSYGTGSRMPAPIYDYPTAEQMNQNLEALKNRPPVYYNTPSSNNFISPYEWQNWGSPYNFISYLDESSRIPVINDKIDPNRIFSAEINGFRRMGNDQQRVIAAFEKKLMESLKDKGSYLNEMDIEAMQALTSARSGLAGINNNIAAIKKNIAELRIKQNQAINSVAAKTEDPNGGGFKSGDVIGVGRNMLDELFNSSVITANSNSNVVPEQNVQYVEGSDAVLDNLLEDAAELTVNPNIKFESLKPKTYVVLGETDDDYHYETHDSAGNIIPDYVNPTTPLKTIDRDAKQAVDVTLTEYPIL